MVNVALYHRVSTVDQSLDRQRDKTQDYASRVWDDPDLEVYEDKHTGTEADRPQFTSLRESLDTLDAVVVSSVSRVARSIRDLDAVAEEMEAADVELHIVEEGLTMDPEANDPYQTAMFQLLGVFAELEAEMAQQRAKDGIAARQKLDDYHHGRPPLGFESNDGELVQVANYDYICAVIQRVAEGSMSKRKAAKKLDTSRRTINRCLERSELYL